jgi:hypothetical protein
VTLRSRLFFGSRCEAGIAAAIRWIRRRSSIVLLLALVATLGSLVHVANNLTINTSTIDMLSEDLPFRENFDALDKAFPQDYRTILVVVEGTRIADAEQAAEKLAIELAKRPDVVLSVFYPESDPFFRRNGLLYLEEPALQDLGDRLAGAQPLLAALARDPSLRGLAEVLTLALNEAPRAGQALPEEFSKALGEIANVADAVALGQGASLDWRRLIAPPDLSEATERRKIIVVEPVLDFGSLEPAALAVAGIRDAIEKSGARAIPGVSVRLTGELLMLQDELVSVKQNIGIVGVLSFILVLGLLIPGLRSWRLFAAASITLIVGLAWTAAFATVTIGRLNLISVSFAIVFIGLAIDFGIHYSLRFKELVDAGIPRPVALDEAGSGVAAGLFLSTVAAAIGFLAFLPTDYKGLSELGLISAGGMALALIANLTVLPALLSVFGLERSQRASPLGIARRLHMYVDRHALAFVIAAALLSLAALATLPWARFDDSALALRDPTSESVATLLDVIEDDRVSPFRALALAPSENEAHALASHLEALPEVKAAVTLSDMIPNRQEEKLALIDGIALLLGSALTPSEQRSPPTPEETRGALQTLVETAHGVGGPFEGEATTALVKALEREWTDAQMAALSSSLLGQMPALLADLRTGLSASHVTIDDLPKTLIDRRRTADGRVLIEILPREDLRDQGNRRRFVDAVQSVIPEATGEAIILTEGGRAVVRSFFEAGAIAAVLIIVLLLVVLRSLGDALIVMAPLTMAGLLTVATGVIIDVPFNFANVIVLPLLFGLGVASGIHMVLRARTERLGRFLETSTPRAVLFSALTTIGSFGSLAVSAHPGMASMGILLMIAITLTTICTILVLPALRDIVGRAL